MDAIKDILSVPADLFGLDPFIFGGIILVLIVLIIMLIHTLANMPKQRVRPGGPKTYGRVTPPNRQTRRIAPAVSPADIEPTVTASMKKVGDGVVSDLPIENTIPADTYEQSDVVTPDADQPPQYDAAAYAAYYSDPNTIAAIAATVEDIRHAL